MATRCGADLQEAVERYWADPAGVVDDPARGPRPFDVKLQRAMIKSSRYAHLENNNIGYVRVTSFNEQTDVGLTNAVKNLKQQANNKPIGIVLDLRNNGDRSTRRLRFPTRFSTRARSFRHGPPR